VPTCISASLMVVYASSPLVPRVCGLILCAKSSSHMKLVQASSVHVAYSLPCFGLCTESSVLPLACAFSCAERFHVEQLRISLAAKASRMEHARAYGTAPSFPSCCRPCSKMMYVDSKGEEALDLAPIPLLSAGCSLSRRCGSGPVGRLGMGATISSY